MLPDSARSGADYNLPQGDGATARLMQEVMARIDTQGPISFQDYFNLVLYHPQDGYYSQPHRIRTGREGDFFTAVSVGSLFGRILSQYAYQTWQSLGQPSQFRIVEWGAEQGDLARDLAAGVAEIGGDFAGSFSYAIVEPIAVKRSALRESLPEVVVVASAVDLAPQPGLVIGNELIDAFAFWLIRFQDGKWWEKRVTRGEEAEGSLAFQLVAPTGELATRLAILADLGPRFSEGYETEIRPSLTPFLAAAAGTLSTGQLLFIDYGYEHDDYYHPARTTGTLRTYGGHQAGEDPLLTPGALDITAHLDFTLLAQEGSAAGLRDLGLQSQGSFLTHAATQWLRAQEGKVDEELFRQFQTLTHPAHLGTRFWVQRFAL